MAVYVDNLRVVKPTAAWRFTMAAHLLADDLEELHSFAAMIGLRRAWFQATRTPHYDLTATRHKLALSKGAKLLNRHELVATARRIRGC